MDLDFKLGGMGIWSATMSSRQWTTKKYDWRAIVKTWCYLRHRAGVASTYSESQKHNPALEVEVEVEKNNTKKSKIAKRMARLDKLCVRQTKLNEGERAGEGG
jgi:hypothetical protein